jgi:hypothetical protein
MTAIAPSGGLSFAAEAWKSSWVHFNCFLAIAALDDARLWGQFLAFASRGRSTGVLNWVPPASNYWKHSLLHCPGVAFGFPPKDCRGYAYWLFAQDGNVYDFTGR